MPKLSNHGVVLAWKRTGAGRRIVFFNGVGATRFVWRRVIANLKGRYEVVTFDFRNHGKSTASPNHSFDAFLSDAESVMKAIGPGHSLVVGFSAGADIALSYAATHPDVVAGLLLVDGAAPISEPLVEDEAKMRRSLNSPLVKLGMLITQLTPYAFKLSSDAIADLTIEVDARRQKLEQLYRQIQCPVRFVLATKTAGENTTDHARRNNRIWREAGERLAARYGSSEVRWIEAGHRLPLTHPTELAREIDDFASTLKS